MRWCEMCTRCGRNQDRAADRTTALTIWRQTAGLRVNGKSAQ